MFYWRFAVGFLAIKVLIEATVIAKISFVSDMILLKLVTSTNLASTIAVLNKMRYTPLATDAHGGLCPMPYALCPMPAKPPHVTEKGYIETQYRI